MLKKYTKISYYEIDDFIFKLSRGVDIPIWKEYDRFNNYKEKAELLLTPFLKELIIKSRCCSIILKEYCEVVYLPRTKSISTTLLKEIIEKEQSA